MDPLFTETRELLQRNTLAVLSTVHEGEPHQGLVAIAPSEDLKSILFATPVYTRKYDNIQNNPRVSLLADDRRGTELDFLKARALTVKGSAEIPSNDETKTLIPEYLAYHPYLDDFVSSPSASLILVRVSRYILVSSFQKVREWTP